MPEVKGGKITRAIAASEPLFVLAIAPYLMFPTPRRLLILLIVPVVWWCAFRTTGRLVPRSPVNVALGLLVAMVLVSLHETFDVLFSLGKVSGTMLGVLVFFATIRWICEERRLWAAVWLFAVAGGALSVITMLGASWIHKFSLIGRVTAHIPQLILGIPGAEEGFHPNAVAGTLVLFLPVQMTGLITAASARLAEETALSRMRAVLLRASYASAFGLTLLVILFTQSRGAWIGLVVAGLVSLCWQGSRGRKVAAGFLIVIGIGVLVFGPGRVSDRVFGRTRMSSAEQLAGRVEIWDSAISGIRDYPVAGMGMNTFRQLMPDRYPKAHYRRPNYPIVDVAHAHNQLFQVALDLGLPGLIAYVAILLVVAALLSQLLRHATGHLRLLAGCLAAALIAHLSFGMTDAIPLGAKPGFAFWLTLALAVSLHDLTRRPATQLSRDAVRQA